MEIDISLTALPKSKSHFADRLIFAVGQKGSPICVGLDPRLSQIPEVIQLKNKQEYGSTFEGVGYAFLEFNKGIIDAVADLVPCVKPQIAFYEQYGVAGMWAFEQTCLYAEQQGLIVIADVKRSDIGSTAQAYADGYLGAVDVFGEPTLNFNVDAVTLNPYMGYDSIKPFLDVCATHDKGVFILVKTSNVSSADIQDQLLDERVSEKFSAEGRMKMHEYLSYLIESWGADDVGESGYSFVGVVVGATYPKEAIRIREILPQSIFLVPGYGAQGGRAQDIKVCFNPDGLGAIVNSSREIIFAHQKHPELDYRDAARLAVEEMKADLG